MRERNSEGEVAEDGKRGRSRRMRRREKRTGMEEHGKEVGDL